MSYDTPAAPWFMHAARGAYVWVCDPVCAAQLASSDPTLGTPCQVQTVATHIRCNHCAWCGQRVIRADTTCVHHGPEACPACDVYQCGILSQVSHMHRIAYGYGLPEEELEDLAILVTEGGYDAVDLLHRLILG